MSSKLSVHLADRASAALVILLAGAALAFFRQHPIPLPTPKFMQVQTRGDLSRDNRSRESSIAAAQTITVTVTGEARKTGPVDILEGTTLKGLFEIVQPTPNAYTAHADYGYVLAAGDEIHIPPAVPKKSGRIELSDDTLQRVRIRSNRRIAEIFAARSHKPLININRAGPDALQTLPRIGPETARRIIEDRESRGPFHTKEDLLRIKGIGRKTYKWIEPLITAE